MGLNTFFFRVDSSQKIGSGHLMRCLTLANRLREIGAECTFVCRALNGNLNRLIVSDGFSLVELPRPDTAFIKSGDSEPLHSDWREVSWKIDAMETTRALSGKNAGWLIVDHYGIWKDWQLVVKDYVGKIMVIDDLADRKHYCDVLLDQNLGSDISLYEKLVPNTCKTFFGPKYALVRPEFAAWRSSSLERRKDGKLKNILINFGGGDPEGYITRTLESLFNSVLSSEITILVIFGGLTLPDDRHQGLISRFQAKIEIYGMVNNMAEILSGSDLVIGAAGSSSWERCALGVPSIVFPIALNQTRIAEQLAASGAVISLDTQDLDNNKLAILVNDLLQGDNLKQMSKKASSMSVGTGLEEIIHELKD